MKSCGIAFRRFVSAALFGKKVNENWAFELFDVFKRFEEFYSNCVRR